MKLVNLTPHSVTLLAEGFAVFDGKAKCYRLPSTMTPFVLAEFPSSGVARCAVEESLLGEKEYTEQFEREGHDCPVYPAIFGVTLAEKFGRIATRLSGEWLWSFPGMVLYAGRV